MFGSGKRIVVARLFAVAALGALGCSEAKENYGCPMVDAVGGPPIGTWSVTQACTVPYDRVSIGDWCSQLVYDANGIRQALLGHPPLPFKGGSITFDGGGHYMSELSFETLPTAPATTRFPRECLNAYGLEPTCGELEGALGTFLGDPGSAQLSYRLLSSLMLLPFYPVGLAPQPSYSNFHCVDDVENSCSCSYTVGLLVPDKGAWNADRTTVLSMFSETAALPYDNDFTSADNTLVMNGHDGMDLMGQFGLRYLVFSKQ